ncbi:MAG TPA: TerC family protein [Gemmatimonadales bacterium]|nr:TerC family protein [Gemmatimonadales bacterium]
MDLGVHPLSIWLGFSGLVVLLLILDLGVLNRRSHVLGFREALTWSGSLVVVAILFGLFMYWREGPQHALEFYTGYLIELSLSVDNLFVFILVFQYFGVPAALQPRVLKWGILGAIVMRLVMILLGALLLSRFDWIVYVFGAILIFAGWKMFRGEQGEVVELERNIVVRAARRLLPFSDRYDGQHFFTHPTRAERHAGVRRVATPLLLVLLVIEWTDLVFAVDSIPAVFAVTRDPFLVYSSNIFAILGLRALFFVLAGLVDKFVYLKPGVALILVFVGLKMLLSAWVHLPALLSLGVILGTLTAAVVLSMLKLRREARAAAA